MEMICFLQSKNLKALRDVEEDMFVISKSPHGMSHDLYDVWGSDVSYRYFLIPTSTGAWKQMNFPPWAAASKLSSLTEYTSSCQANMML